MSPTTTQTVAHTIDVISDVVCPWCWIGKRRLEKALAGRTDVRVRWHPFQLNPDLPKAGLPRREYWRAKFGSDARIAEITGRVTEAARGEGLAFDLDRIGRQPNTLDAHRVIWLADLLGVQDAVVEALFRGFFRDGRDVGDRATLVELASGAGLDRARVEQLLGSDEGLAEVKKDELHARRLGVEGVPFFVLDQKVGLSGAQEPATFLEAFEEAGFAGAPGAVCEVRPGEPPTC